MGLLSRRRTILGGLGLLVALLGRPAAGQEVKPYVMLLVDTSGSMIWDLCHSDYSCIDGDNSSECPGNLISCAHCSAFGCGNGIRDDTRLYKVKKGAYNVVSAFGEVTFGLSRFRQAPASFTCDASSEGRAGGWTYVYCDSFGPDMGLGGNQADVLVELSDSNQVQILNWMNNCQDWSSTAGTSPGSCGPSDTPPYSSPPYAPVTGCSLCTDCGGGCDLELRGSGITPIAGSLYDLRVNYFPMVLAGDAKKSCRPYRVILLTDGENNCKGSPVTEAANLYNNPSKSIPVHVVGFAASGLKASLDAIAKAGGTGSAIVVDNELSLSLAMASIVSESILNEKCNGTDDDCDGLCDETWPEVAVTSAGCSNLHGAQTCTAGVGACNSTGEYVCRADGTGSECNATPGSPGTEICGNFLDDDCDGAIDEGCVPCVPQPEVCDGKDNDCDGSIDEGYLSTSCGTNIGECVAGTTACVSGKVVCNGATGPATEVCDNKDNNCDTIVDSFTRACYPAASGCDLTTGVCQGICKLGSELCTNGSWGSCLGYQGPATEVCNGLDDDCDGSTDEGVASTCMDYATCTTYASCSACPTKPTEVCDGNDNDCNGKIDDNPLLVGTTCGSSVGECTKGAWACENGKLICKGGVGPQAEVCDGKDNDCNGSIDDSIPGLGIPCGYSIGECTQGVTQCIGGKVVCSGVGPQAEVCDGKDNDCNGNIDDGIPAAACGSDVGECKQGTSTCISGKIICQGGVDPQAEVCDNKDNNCNGLVDDSPIDEGKPCGSDVGQCTKGTTKCVKGKFICVGGVEPTKEICDGKDNDCDGKTDENAECPGASACIEGKCSVPCVGEFSCPGGTRCVNGYCMPDKCFKVTCKDTDRCIDGDCVEKCSGIVCGVHDKCEPTTGQCVDNSCLTKGCPDGKSCINYQCIDNPCTKDTCPGGQMCIDGECYDTCANVTCPAGQVCVRGKCTTDPCAGIECGSNHTCKVIDGEGKCVPDPCRLVTCNPGEICHDGSCIADPCKTTRCPEGFECKVDHAGQPDCKVIAGHAMATTTQVLATGAGGCSCETGGGGGPGTGTLLLLGLFGLVHLRARREG